MNVILNEVRECERILSTGNISCDHLNTIRLLSRYFRQCEGKSKKETTEEIYRFLSKNCPDLNLVLWGDVIEKEIGHSHKYPLRKIDCVWVSKKELASISKLCNLKLEKLVFTMLCFAKLYDATNPSNNGWVNTPIQELYKIARVSVKRRNDKYLYLNDIEGNHLLGDVGLISFSPRNDNTNLKVNFVDAGAHDFKIDDFRELGYEYMLLCELGRFKRCNGCGRLIRLTNRNDHSTKYCSECKRQIKRRQNREIYARSRNSGKAN